MFPPWSLYPLYFFSPLAPYILYISFPPLLLTSFIFLFPPCSLYPQYFMFPLTPYIFNISSFPFAPFTSLVLISFIFLTFSLHLISSLFLLSPYRLNPIYIFSRYKSLVWFMSSYYY